MAYNDDYDIVNIVTYQNANNTFTFSFPLLKTRQNCELLYIGSSSTAAPVFTISSSLFGDNFITVGNSQALSVKIPMIKKLYRNGIYSFNLNDTTGGNGKYSGTITLIFLFY